MLTHLQNIDVSMYNLWYFPFLPLSLFLPSYKILNFMSLWASTLCTERYPSAWNNCTTRQMMQLYRNGKKWTRLLCRFKFRNRREERDNSRVFRRQSYSRVKGQRGWWGGCFAVLHVQNSYNALECLHLLKTLWDFCVWSVCADLYSMDNENEEYFGSWNWLCL